MKEIPKIRFPFCYKQYVAWGEMDAFQHLNHIVYARYFENARVEFLKELGIWKPKEKSEYGPIITNLQIRYIKQVQYPDFLDITLGIFSLGSKNFSIACTMWNQAQELVVKAVGDFLWFNFATQKINSLPKHLKNELEKYQIRLL